MPTLRKCIVCGGMGNAIFRLPEEPAALKDTWMEFFNKYNVTLVYKTVLVCYKHFDDELFIRGSCRSRLKKGSVPTIFAVEETVADADIVEDPPVESDTKDSTETELPVVAADTAVSAAAVDTVAATSVEDENFFMDEEYLEEEFLEDFDEVDDKTSNNDATADEIELDENGIYTIHLDDESDDDYVQGSEKTVELESFAKPTVVKPEAAVKSADVKKTSEVVVKSAVSTAIKSSPKPAALKLPTKEPEVARQTDKSAWKTLGPAKKSFQLSPSVPKKPVWRPTESKRSTKSPVQVFTVKSIESKECTDKPVRAFAVKSVTKSSLKPSADRPALQKSVGSSPVVIESKDNSGGKTTNNKLKMAIKPTTAEKTQIKWISEKPQMETVEKSNPKLVAKLTAKLPAKFTTKPLILKKDKPNATKQKKPLKPEVLIDLEVSDESDDESVAKQSVTLIDINSIMQKNTNNVVKKAVEKLLKNPISPDKEIDDKNTPVKLPITYGKSQLKQQKLQASNSADPKETDDTTIKTKLMTQPPLMESDNLKLDVPHVDPAPESEVAIANPMDMSTMIPQQGTKVIEFFKDGKMFLKRIKLPDQQPTKRLELSSEGPSYIAGTTISKVPNTVTKDQTESTVDAEDSYGQNLNEYLAKMKEALHQPKQTQTEISPPPPPPNKASPAKFIPKTANDEKNVIFVKNAAKTGIIRAAVTEEECILSDDPPVIGPLPPLAAKRAGVFRVAPSSQNPQFNVRFIRKKKPGIDTKLTEIWTENGTERIITSPPQKLPAPPQKLPVAPPRIDQLGRRLTNETNKILNHQSQSPQSIESIPLLNMPTISNNIDNSVRIASNVLKPTEVSFKIAPNLSVENADMPFRIYSVQGSFNEAAIPIGISSSLNGRKKDPIRVFNVAEINAQKRSSDGEIRTANVQENDPATNFGPSDQQPKILKVYGGAPKKPSSIDDIRIVDVQGSVQPLRISNVQGNLSAKDVEGIENSNKRIRLEVDRRVNYQNEYIRLMREEAKIAEEHKRLQEQQQTVAHSTTELLYNPELPLVAAPKAVMYKVAQPKAVKPKTVKPKTVRKKGSCVRMDIPFEVGPLEPTETFEVSEVTVSIKKEQLLPDYVNDIELDVPTTVIYNQVSDKPSTEQITANQPDSLLAVEMLPADQNKSVVAADDEAKSTSDQLEDLPFKGFSNSDEDASLPKLPKPAIVKKIIKRGRPCGSLTTRTNPAKWVEQHTCSLCYETFDKSYKLKRHLFVGLHKYKTKPTETKPPVTPSDQKQLMDCNDSIVQISTISTPPFAPVFRHIVIPTVPTVTAAVEPVDEIIKTGDMLFSIKTLEEDTPPAPVAAVSKKVVKGIVLEPLNEVDCPTCKITFPNPTALEAHRWVTPMCFSNFWLNKSGDASAPVTDVTIKQEKSDTDSENEVGEKAQGVGAIRVRKSKNHKCSYCNRSYKSLFFVRAHEQERCYLRPAKLAQITIAPPPTSAKNPIFKSRRKRIFTKVKRQTTRQRLQMCKVCNESFPSLQVHRLTCVDKTPHKCNVCPEQFAKAIGLTNHIIACHPKKSKRPNMKSYIPESKPEIKKETEPEIKKEIKKPEIKADRKPQLLKRTRFLCRLCNERFHEKNLLLKHLKTHANKCPNCPKMYRNAQCLENHILLVHFNVASSEVTTPTVE